ncbi:MAG: DEAD/DEAH box helicase, partial [Sulfobacillus sp.]
MGSVTCYQGTYNGPEPDHEFSFALDDFQKHSIAAINRGENVLVSVPTGSGKTCVAIHAIRRSLNSGRRVVYTSPIKSLSNQKYREFKEIFPSVGILTGDLKFDPCADCLVVTTEILRNAALAAQGENGREPSGTAADQGRTALLDRVSTVIFDEIHYINDRDRGHVWEETLQMLPASVSLVMLSATIDRPEKFAQWISELKGRPVAVVLLSRRKVPLSHAMWDGNSLQEYLSSESPKTFKEAALSLSSLRANGRTRSELDSPSLSSLVDFLCRRSLFPALFFVFSRRRCEVLAASLSRSFID